MYLHVGGDHAIPVRSIVAIVDWRVRRAAATREFLDLQRSEGRLHDLSEGSPKACIITDRGTFLSAISAATLQRRAVQVQGDAQTLY